MWLIIHVMNLCSYTVSRLPMPNDMHAIISVKLLQPKCRFVSNQHDLLTLDLGHPKKYAHGSRFVVFCYGLVLSILPISLDCVAWTPALLTIDNVAPEPI